MSELLITSDDRLYELPLVDSFRFDGNRNAYLIFFAPSDDVSDEPKEFIAIGNDSRDFDRVQILFFEIGRLVAPGKTISQIVHSGGGNYTFQFADGSQTELADVADNSISMQVADRLKQIADAAQMTFRQAAHLNQQFFHHR